MIPTDRYVAQTTLYVRYAETDAMAVVHHASYIVYFEEGRSSYTRQRGRSYADLERGGFMLIVTEVNSRYHKPAVYDDRVTIHTWVSELRSRGLTFSYSIVNTETNDLLVSGSTKHLCVDRSGKVCPLPQDWREIGN